jgi:hypothetical protein
MNSKLKNWLLYSNQQLLRYTALILGFLCGIVITVNAYNDYLTREEREQQSALVGRCVVLRYTDKRGFVYITGIYKGGSENDLRNYNSTDTLISKEEAFQFQKKQNEIIQQNEVHEAYENMVEVVVPD